MSELILDQIRQNHKDYLGKKVTCEFLVNAVEFNLNKVFHVVKTDQRYRKLTGKYKVAYKEHANGTTGIELVYGKGVSLYKEALKLDVKKAKTIVLELLNLINKHGREIAKENYNLSLDLKVKEVNSLMEKDNLPMMFDRIPEDVYHKTEGLSKSQLSHVIKKSYEHYKFYKEEGYDSKALSFGRAFHSRLLGESEFKKTNFVMSELDQRKKADKVEYNRMVLENAHKNIVSKKNYDSIVTLVNKMKSHPVVSLFLEEGLHEHSFYWKNNIGTLSRGRADTVIPSPSEKLTKLLKKNYPGYKGEGVVIDYKTTEDASKSEFERSVLKYLYHVQAAAYTEAMEKLWGKKFIMIFVAIEKSGPQSVAWFYMDDAAIEAGSDEYYYGLCMVKKHESEKDGWKGYPLRAQALSIPGYGFTRAANYKLRTERLMEELGVKKDSAA